MRLQTGAMYATALDKVDRRANTFEKRKPRVIMQDKEELYDNAIQLKRSANTLREENYRLKAKIQQYEEDSMKKSKIMQELMAQLNNTASMRAPAAFHKEVRSTVVSLRARPRLSLH